MNAVIIDEKDNVAVAIEPIRKGEQAQYSVGGAVKTVTVLEEIPIYHKFATAPIAKGGTVVKYGEYIGFALRDIRAGEHVHVHNIDNRAEVREALEK